jgi:hypothetical protein
VQPVIATPPLRNSTVPVGLPAPGAVTEIVAVSVTLCPTTEGLTLEVTAVVVEALPTLSLSAVEVEAE